MKLDDVFTAEILTALESRIVAKTIKTIRDDPTLLGDPVSDLVPLKGSFLLKEVYDLRGISASTVGIKPWLRINVREGDRPTRLEVIEYLRKSDAELRAEYELRIQALGGAS